MLGTIVRGAGLILILLGLTLPVGAQGTRHVDSAHHFEAEIPEGWYPIQQALVDAVDRDFDQRLGSQKNFRYVSGFSMSEEGLISFPYVLFQITEGKMNRTSEAALVKALNAKSLETEAEGILNENLSDLMADADLGPVNWDEAAKRVIMPLSAEINGIGPVRGIAVGKVSSEALVQINCYSLASQFDAAMPAFQQWIDSLRIEEGYEWRPGSEVDWTSVGVNALIGAVVGALIGLGIVAVRRFRRS